MDNREIERLFSRGESNGWEKILVIESYYDPTINVLRSIVHNRTCLRESIHALRNFHFVKDTSQDPLLNDQEFTCWREDLPHALVFLWNMNCHTIAACILGHLP